MLAAFYQRRLIEIAAYFAASWAFGLDWVSHNVSNWQGCTDLQDSLFQRNGGPSLERHSPIADFRKPPVVETALGFYFAPLPSWTFVHFGALWEKFKDKYPRVEYKAPIQNPGQSQPLMTGMLSDIGKLPLRLCFIDESNTQLVQVQNGRFLHNWRKTDETASYQHYESIRPILLQDWRIFCDFIKDHSLQQPQVLRCEITYFNHLVRGEDWQSIADWPQMFPGWQLGEIGELPTRLERVNLSVWYEHSAGTVQVSVSPGIRQVDGKQVVQLKVSGLATPAGSASDDLFRCLDICHDSAIASFVKLTSEQLHKKWGRIR